MITSTTEYYELLYRIQDQNRLIISSTEQTPPIPIPSEEAFLHIDLNTRSIEAPEYLSVQFDHNAETLFFCIDRYCDSVDLATMTAVVQYVNAAGESRIYPVPFYDTVTLGSENKMLIPWSISGEATKKAGMVQYSIRFYTIDLDNRTFAYNLNTLPAESEVLYGMESDTPEDYSVSADFINIVNDRLARLEKTYELYWLTIEDEEE